MFADGGKYEEMARMFFSKLQQSDIFLYFKQICKIDANRATKMQISMVHIKSGVQFLILFRKNARIIESTEIIKKFAGDPLCMFFVVSIVLVIIIVFY